ncbi:MAG: hypothetical protein R3251_00660 [Candidatus Spechtbacterales bacterium]|nr:hypothetical protein [Candidatus Spechtbacterales bacterium]
MREFVIVVIVVVVAFMLQLIMGALTAPVWIALAVFGHFVLGALTYRVVTHFDKSSGPVNENIVFGSFVLLGYIMFAIALIAGAIYVIIQVVKASTKFLKAVGGVE